MRYSILFSVEGSSTRSSALCEKNPVIQPTIIRVFVCTKNFESIIEFNVFEVLALRKRTLCHNSERSRELDKFNPGLEKCEEADLLQIVREHHVFQFFTLVEGFVLDRPQHWRETNRFQPAFLEAEFSNVLEFLR